MDFFHKLWYFLFEPSPYMKLTIYSVDICRAGNHDTTGIGLESSIQLSSDPEETKLDYHREDTMLHVYHELFHSIFAAVQIQVFPRKYELFFYMHQQMMRR